MFAGASGTGVKMINKRNRNNFIKVNGLHQEAKGTDICRCRIYFDNFQKLLLK